MEPMNWGVLSTANIGTATVIPALQQSELCTVTAIASRDRSRADQAAAALGIQTAHGSYEALLADPSIEAVYIPLPNHLHVPMAVAAANAGKHVLVEKPVALHADELGELIAARDANGVQVQEAFMVCSHPQWTTAIGLIRGGEIGELRSINTVFSYFNDDADDVRNQADIGGGALYDIGCYGIIAARLLFGHEPSRAVSLIDRDPGFGTDRLVSSLLDFGSGQASITVSTQLVPFQIVQAFGTRGRLEIEIPFNAPTTTTTRLFTDDGSEHAGQSRREITIDIVNQYSAQGDAFVRSVRGEAAPAMTLEDSLANMQVIDAIFASADTGGWVRVGAGSMS